MLVVQGSNLTDTDDDGNRLIDLALRYNHSDLAMMLKEKFVCTLIECLNSPMSQCGRGLRAFYGSKECQVHKKSWLP